MKSTEAERLAADVGAFVRAGDGDQRFEQLARRVFALQYERVEPFRRLCDARGVTPGMAGWSWRSVPAVPTSAFRTLALHVAAPREIFRSSGTTGGEGRRSVHRHPFPDLYRTVIEASFAAACLPPGSPADDPRRRPILSLVPSRAQAPDSSLGFMCEHVMRRHGLESEDGTRTAFGDDGVDVAAANAFVRAHAGRPVTVLATAFALAQWLDELAESFRLAPGSTVMETGGFKGRHREVARADLLTAIRSRLGVPSDHVVREYGMTELTGHVYTRVLRGGDGEVFVTPPWMRVRLLDPETLCDVPAGDTGLVSIFDLANVGSAVHVVSQDVGRAEDGGGFRLLGRAEGADLRGCSLTVEELTG